MRWFRKMMKKEMAYIGSVIVLGIVTTLTGGNQIDCKKQDFPIHLRGSLEALLELESRSFNWTLELIVSNPEATLAQIIFDFGSCKLMINCTDTKKKWKKFQHGSTYKLKVNKNLIEVEQQLMSSGEFYSVSKEVCRLPKSFYNATLERFDGPEDNGLSISVCSPLNSTSAPAPEDTSTTPVILVGITIAVTAVVSAVMCVLRRKKKNAASRTRSPSNPNRQESGGFFVTRIQQGPPVSDFDWPLCLNRRQLPTPDDSSYATTHLSSSRESMNLGPLRLHGYSGNLTQEPLAQSTLTLPELPVSPSPELTDAQLSSFRGCNDYRKSQSSLASSSLTPTGHSHLVVRSPSTSRLPPQSPQLTIPNTNFSRALQDDPSSHYSTTGRSLALATVRYQNLNNAPIVTLRRNSADDVEDNAYERVTLLFP